MTAKKANLNKLADLIFKKIGFARLRNQIELEIECCFVKAYPPQDLDEFNGLMYANYDVMLELEILAASMNQVSNADCYKELTQAERDWILKIASDGNLSIHATRLPSPSSIWEIDAQVPLVLHKTESKAHHLRIRVEMNGLYESECVVTGTTDVDIDDVALSKLVNMYALDEC